MQRARRRRARTCHVLAGRSLPPEPEFALGRHATVRKSRYSEGWYEFTVRGHVWLAFRDVQWARVRDAALAADHGDWETVVDAVAQELYPGIRSIVPSYLKED